MYQASKHSQLNSIKDLASLVAINDSSWRIDKSIHLWTTPLDPTIKAVIGAYEIHQTYSKATHTKKALQLAIELAVGHWNKNIVILGLNRSQSSQLSIDFILYLPILNQWSLHNYILFGNHIVSFFYFTFHFEPVSLHNYILFCNHAISFFHFTFHFWTSDHHIIIFCFVIISYLYSLLNCLLIFIINQLSTVTIIIS